MNRKARLFCACGCGEPIPIGSYFVRGHRARAVGRQSFPYEKPCDKCGEVKPLSAFTPDKKRPDGRVASCRPCRQSLQKAGRHENIERTRAHDRAYRAANRERTNAYSRKWRQAHPEEQKKATLRWRARSPEKRLAAHRRHHFRREYGISLDELAAIIARQGGKCAICAKAFEPRVSGPTHGPHVDHDHETGVVRGVLCKNCNLMIGMAKDDVANLAAGIAYLREFARRAVQAS